MSSTLFRVFTHGNLFLVFGTWFVLRLFASVVWFSTFVPIVSSPSSAFAVFLLSVGRVSGRNLGKHVVLVLASFDGSGIKFQSHSFCKHIHRFSKKRNSFLQVFKAFERLFFTLFQNHLSVLFTDTWD